MKLEQESSGGNLQGDLFSTGVVVVDPPQEHPVLLQLRTIIPDELSPKEALEQLYILKKIVESEWH